jgi:hypothetical protein
LIINVYTLVFFEQYLKNNPSPLLVGSSSVYPEMRWLRAHKWEKAGSSKKREEQV